MLTKFLTEQYAEENIQFYQLCVDFETVFEEKGRVVNQSGDQKRSDSKNRDRDKDSVTSRHSFSKFSKSNEHSKSGSSGTLLETTLSKSASNIGMVCGIVAFTTAEIAQIDPTTKGSDGEEAYNNYGTPPSKRMIRGFNSTSNSQVSSSQVSSSCDQDLTPSIYEQAMKIFKKIYTDFIEGSIINLNSHLFQDFKTKLELYETDIHLINVNSLQQQKLHIYNLLRSDCYPRFLKSDVYKELFKEENFGSGSSSSGKSSGKNSGHGYGHGGYQRDKSKQRDKSTGKQKNVTRENIHFGPKNVTKSQGQLGTSNTHGHNQERSRDSVPERTTLTPKEMAGVTKNKIKHHDSCVTGNFGHHGKHFNSNFLSPAFSGGGAGISKVRQSLKMSKLKDKLGFHHTPTHTPHSNHQKGEQYRETSRDRQQQYFSSINPMKTPIPSPKEEPEAMCSSRVIYGVKK